MIRDLFVPTRIGSFYIIPQHTLGVDMSSPHTFLTARVVSMAETITIEATSDGAASPATLNQVLESCPPCTIHSCISSEQVIFKTLTLPFLKREQIAQVIAYEIEPILPFPLKNAVFDFIVTNRDTNTKSAEVLVAAIQKQYVQQHLEIFTALGRPPSVITIDIIALYELLLHIPSYATYKGALILIVLSKRTTTLAYMVDGVLKLIRVISKAYTNEQSYWSQINFTLNSFSSQVAPSLESKILLIEQEKKHQNLEKEFHKATTITSELFDVSHLLQIPHLVSELPKAQLQKNLISIAVAMPPIEDNGFNINKLEDIDARTLISKQLLILSLLIFSTLGALCASYFFQVYRFKKAVYDSSSEAITTLVNTFGQDIKPKTMKSPVKALQRVTDAAQRKVSERQKLWFAFSAPAQVAFLRYLYELFTGLDHQALGLTIEKLTIKEGTLSLKGHVKDFEALEQFTAYTKQTPLFNRITRGDLQSPSFDIDIEFNPNGEDDD